MNEKLIFGENLKKIREEKGFSQEDFAKLLGSSKQVISRYENNKRTPKITVAADYANILNIPIGALLYGEIAASGRVAEDGDAALYTTTPNEK